MTEYTGLSENTGECVIAESDDIIKVVQGSRLEYD